MKLTRKYKQIVLGLFVGMAFIAVVFALAKFQFFKKDIGARADIFLHEYSDQPLKKNMIMNKAKWVVDAIYFNNYLVETQEEIPAKNIKQLKEHLYLIIDSIIKGKHSENRESFSQHEVYQLMNFFSLATSLHVPGAGLVASHFKKQSQSSYKVIASLPIPEPFSLSFNYPYYFFNSKNSGWKVRFPYYFMIGTINKFIAKNGQDTEILMISTPFAFHKKQDGHSQATLMLIYSEAKDQNKFQDFWIKLHGLDLSNQTEAELYPNSINFKGYDESRNLFKEITFFRLKKGNLAVSYSGINGTYQDNRSYYIDFLKNIMLN